MTTQTATQFFFEHAGYSTPPGREECARQMAEAEAKAREASITFEWVTDAEGCTGCECGQSDCDCASGADHETLGCIARSEKGDVLASLWGICGATHEYQRVVEAELASEAFS